MAKRYELRRGDTCPCCGQTIETDDPDALKILTLFAKYLPDYEWPEEDVPT